MKLRRIFDKLPSLPRFTDKTQRQAGGNIVKFLAGLLALTLIARGTSGATLARVDVAGPARGEIVESVTGSASVSVRDTYDITVPEGLTIVDILVGTGQTVNYGDVVALFDMEEIKEKQTRETANLDKLILELEKLERAVDTDSSSLESARRSLNRNLEDYNDVKTQGEEDVATAMEAFEEALAGLAEDPDAAALEAAWRSLRRSQEDYYSTSAQGISDIAAAQSALRDAEDSRSDSVDSNALENARRNRTRARDDHNAVRTQTNALITTAKNAHQEALDALKELEDAAAEGEPVDEEDLLAAQAKVEMTKEALAAVEKKAAEDLQASSRRLEDAEAAYNQAQQNYNNSARQASDMKQTAIDNAKNALENAKKRADDNLLAAGRRVEDAEIALAQAQQNYEKNVEQESDKRQSVIENANNALDAAKKRADDNLLAAARRVEDSEASLAQAGVNYNKNAQQSSDTATQNSVSAIAVRLDIKDQKAVVDALYLLAVSEGVLYSDITGIVSSTRAKGDVTGQSALIAFMDDARGFEAGMLLNNTEANKLAVGDECQVAIGGGSMYYNPTVTGVVSAIAPPNEQDKVSITIRLPEGDWSEGQTVDIQIVQNRSTYDMCVPLSALRSDNAGYYLLTVEQNSTILGVENAVIRVAVTVTASDDDSAAIQGPVSRTSKIITGSNKAVAVGDRVRINDQ